MSASNQYTFIGSYWPDSPERQENLLAFLSHYDAAGVNVKLLTSNQPRTVSINQLLPLVTTPYVGVCDVDGILDPQILEQATKQFEDGADVVYPYTHVRQGGEMWHPSFNMGILVLFKTEKYQLMGGENEQFRDWGWEDFERYYRALNHGFRVSRLNTTIEHRAHPHNRGDPTKRRENYRLMLLEKQKYESNHPCSVD